MVWLPNNEAYFYQLVMHLTGWVAFHWPAVIGGLALLVIVAWIGDNA
jgi:hypothetical protein